MKYDLNHELEQAKDEIKEAQELPEAIRMRLDHTYQLLENTPHIRKKGWLLPGLLIAVAAAGLLIIGSGFISPVMAEALRNIPIIGSIFINGGDEGLKTASRQGMTSDIHQSITHDGITMSISEMMYDGSRISMVLTRTTKDGKNEPFGKLGSQVNEQGETNWIRFYADGNELNFGYRVSKAGDNAANSDIVTLSPDGLPDEFILKAVIRDISVSEPFTFNIPVKNSAVDSLSMKSEEPKIHDNIHMSISSLKITPATMQLIVSISGKPGQSLTELNESVPDKYKIGSSINMEYDVMNEKGELAQSLGGSGGGTDGVLKITYMYEPFPTKPKSITIRPYVQNAGDKIYIPELEFHLPVEE